MINFPPTVRIFLAVGPADLRKGFDGLAALTSSTIGLDPLCGHLFVFRNRRGDRVKVLVWDQSGFWILYKRLEEGTFAWPVEDVGGPVEMQQRDLLLLLSGVDVAGTRRRRWYDRVVGVS